MSLLLLFRPKSFINRVADGLGTVLRSAPSAIVAQINPEGVTTEQKSQDMLIGDSDSTIILMVKDTNNVSNN